MKTTGDNALRLAGYLLEKGLQGLPPLSSAQELATEYSRDPRYPNADARVHSLIRWETTKNFASGLVVGLGGVLTLPVTLPASLGASWVFQARLAGAIATLYGHRLSEQRVQTLVLLSLLGDAGKETLKGLGMRVGETLVQRWVEQIPNRTLSRINQHVGFALLGKSGHSALLQLSKLAPIAGAFLGGTLDAAACRTVGHVAQQIFRNRI